MIFNYIELRTKVVCTYVVSHHIICQPGASFCSCQAKGGARETDSRQTVRGREGERVELPPTRRTFSGDKVLQKLLKMCCKCIGKSFPFWGTEFIWDFLILFIFFAIYDNLFLAQDTPAHTMQLIVTNNLWNKFCLCVCIKMKNPCIKADKWRIWQAFPIWVLAEGCCLASLNPFQGCQAQAWLMCAYRVANTEWHLSSFRTLLTVIVG